MEDMLSDVQAGVEEDEEEGITSVNFFRSLMGAMQGGTGTAMPNGTGSGTPTPATPEMGQTIYGSSARPK
jgi:hypothetical protein